VFASPGQRRPARSNRKTLPQWQSQLLQGIFRQHRPISEVAARPIEVGSMGHSGWDLLTLSSSLFDPHET
jgi:hypothetical protein